MLESALENWPKEILSLDEASLSFLWEKDKVRMGILNPSKNGRKRSLSFLSSTPSGPRTTSSTNRSSAARGSPEKENSKGRNLICTW